MQNRPLINGGQVRGDTLFTLSIQWTRKSLLLSLARGSPVPIELDGKICHDLQGLVSQLKVHGDGANLAGEGARDLQPLGLHCREPDLLGRGQEGLCASSSPQNHR